MSSVFVVLFILCFAVSAAAQQPTGGISGIVSDPTGAVVPEATVTVTNRATGVTVTAKTSPAGVFTVSSLLPGEYEIKVESAGFRTLVRTVSVLVGRTTAADAQLEVGLATETVTVESTGIAVATTETSIQGVITTEMIRDLPLSGRNFLDLGQLEPGVQVQDGGNFDPTKNQFTGLSIAGSTGRTTRVTVDGIDITDETVGTTTQNISQDAIQEFQISRNTNDVSTDLTDTGAVNVVSKSGSNDIHGDAFLLFRSEDGAARVGQEQAAFDREQVGFNVGGAFIRDKLFWFANYERNNQDGATSVNIPASPSLGGNFGLPFDERLIMGRLDWNVTPSVRGFYRYSHNWNEAIASSSLGGVRLEPFANQNISNVHAAGFDATVGQMTHSFRYGFVNFNNAIVDSGGCEFAIAIVGQCVNIRFVGAGGITRIGHSRLAPQQTLQDNHQFRYDGAYVFGRHAVRWGSNVTIIRGNIFAPFFSGAPEIRITVNATEAANIAAGTVPGQVSTDPQNLANYPITFGVIGNGLGFFSDVATLGFPFGGAKNTRFHWYVADTWRISNRFTLNYGLRYIFEAGNINPDFDKPASLENFMAGLSVRTPQDKNNIAPHVGLAWDPTGRGKTVVRAGGGIYYAPNIFNNTLFERAQFIPPGVGFDFAFPGLGNVISPLDGSVIWDGTFPVGGPSISGQALGTPGLISQILSAAATFEAQSNAATATFPSGPTVFDLTLTTAGNLFDPAFETPYSIHFSAGIQHELRSGLVVSVDYLRQRGLHSVMRRDFNRVGAADTLNVANAQAAIAATLVDCGVSTIDQAIVGCPSLSGGRPATISDFISNGLGGGASATTAGPNPEAFPGLNPNFNTMQLLGMQGKSEYNALQVQLRGTVPDLGQAIMDHRLSVSYSLSRLEANSLDTAFLANPVFNDNVTAFFGPSQLDRTHMFSASSIFRVPGDVQIASIWRFNSRLPKDVFLDQSLGGGGEIFFTDLDGDGTVADPLPGTNRGSFGRSIGSPEELNAVISNFNSSVAGGFTPAAQALIDASLFTGAQLQALGAVIPSVSPAPSGQLMLDNFMTADARVSKIFRGRDERWTFEIGMEWFNLFNVGNYDLPGNTLSSTLSGGIGSINGTTALSRPNRAGFGGGSFAQGIPRSWQIAMRVSF